MGVLTITILYAASYTNLDLLPMVSFEMHGIFWNIIILLFTDKENKFQQRSVYCLEIHILIANFFNQYIFKHSVLLNSMKHFFLFCICLKDLGLLTSKMDSKEN